ncbi:MAG: hypothetical protein K2N63_07405, partial [Lachnospiraceae bacterium]|nr:hypothetical protein [Lachnospiraceae bacterium]
PRLRRLVGAEMCILDRITGKIKNICFRYRLKEDEVARICVNGRNLVPPLVEYGHFKKGEEKIYAKGNKQYRHTCWFPILEEGKFLVMGGDAYNRAIWQFKRRDGEILTDIPTEKKYRLASGKLTNVTFPKVAIPSGVISARVYYAKDGDEETLPLGNRLQIEYGLVPTFYETWQQQVSLLPKLKEEEELFYQDGGWFIREWADGIKRGKISKEKKILDTSLPMEIKIGDMVTLKIVKADGTVLEDQGEWMQVCYESPEVVADHVLGEEYQKREYGVRIYHNDSVPVCERIGDAVGLHFNYRLGSEEACLYQNDFDHIFPWCAMRRCAVSFAGGKRRIVYEGEEGYATDGSAGEVMVEIPKHYVARRAGEGFEEILISPEKKEGFVPDPSFVTPQGEVDAVYVGAYFAAEELEEGGGMALEPAPKKETDGLMLVSRAGMQISLYRSGEEFLAMALRNRGFGEIDLFAALMLQRLFLVETAILDSQSIFEGNVYMPYLIWDRKATYYSSENVLKTNSIRMRDNSISRRYRVGDAVAVMDTWKTFFEPGSGNMLRVVTARTKEEDGRVNISFSGAPIDLVANSTGMSELPEHTGSTDALRHQADSSFAGGYSREEFGGQCAHDAFCYRGVENIWGGIWVVLSGCTVKDNRLTVCYPNGQYSQVSYELPKQNVNLSSKQFGDPDRMYVRRMGYDEQNPLVALPCEIGGGAGNCSYYCDAWFNEANPGEEYIVTYGGAWDNMAYAGLFAFRASFTPQKRVTFNGARLMCR